MNHFDKRAIEQICGPNIMSDRNKDLVIDIFRKLLCTLKIILLFTSLIN